MRSLPLERELRFLARKKRQVFQILIENNVQGVMFGEKEGIRGEI